MDTALTMMLSGQAQTARQWVGSGLLDDVVSEDLIDAACARAISLADELAVHAAPCPAPVIASLTPPTRWPA